MWEKLIVFKVFIKNDRSNDEARITFTLHFCAYYKLPFKSLSLAQLSTVNSVYIHISPNSPS